MLEYFERELWMDALFVWRGRARVDSVRRDRYEQGPLMLAAHVNRPCSCRALVSRRGGRISVKYRNGRPEKYRAPDFSCQKEGAAQTSMIERQFLDYWLD